MRQLAAREALLGDRLAKEHPKEYRAWLVSRVGSEGSVKEMEQRYHQKFNGVLAAQGFYAFKAWGEQDAENKFIKMDYPF